MPSHIFVAGWMCPRESVRNVLARGRVRVVALSEVHRAVGIVWCVALPVCCAAAECDAVAVSDSAVWQRIEPHECPVVITYLVHSSVVFWRYFSSRVFTLVAFNPRPTGGGGYFEPPLWFSCDIF